MAFHRYTIQMNGSYVVIKLTAFSSSSLAELESMGVLWFFSSNASRAYIIHPHPKPENCWTTSRHWAENNHFPSNYKSFNKNEKKTSPANVYPHQIEQTVDKLMLRFSAPNSRLFDSCYILKRHLFKFNAQFNVWKAFCCALFILLSLDFHFSDSLSSVC